MSTVARLKRFRDRHRDGVIQAVLADVAERAYFRPAVRALVRPFVAPREPQKWLFLVGCYNSGTTIARQVLGMHPEIRILPREGVRFTSALPRPEDVDWTRMWFGCPDHMAMPDGHQRDRYEQIVADWSPWWRSGGTVFLEKSISNITRIDWLNRNFPNAYFVGIVRNGYCVVEGIRRRARPGPSARQVLGSESYPIDMVAKQWVAANEMLLRAQREIPRFHLIRYEDLVSDPPAELGRVWDFLGVRRPAMSWDDGRLEIGDQSVRLVNMNQESISRLDAQSLRNINDVIGPMQAEFGYEILGGEV